MSKRSSRNKKGGDANVPNFVFQMGNATPGFNSTPSSPSGSVTGFGFNNPSSPATSVFTLQRGQSEISPKPEQTTLRRTTSEGTLNPSTTQPITFGQPFTAPPIQKQNSTNSLSSQSSFTTPATGFSIAATPATASTGFTFAPPSTAAATPNASSFSFNSSASSTNTFGTPATTTASSFGTPATTTASSFGTPTTTTTSAFGTPATTTTSTFGIPAASTTAPTFSTPAASTTAPTFGTPATPAFGTPATTTPAPTFGTPATTTTTTTTTAPTFSFGTPASTTATTTTTAPTFSFGTPASTTATTSAPTISFGTPATTSATTTAPTFSFGTPATTTTTSATTTASTATSSTGTTTSTTPAIGTLATSTPSLSFGTTTSSASSSTISFGSKPADNKTTSQPTETKKEGFSFGKKEDKPASLFSTTTTAAVPSKPNQFSFAKILEDLEKAATAQVPMQMNATLVPALIQQTVHHTSFVIDNIMPSTRFTELPEQAQKELDELEKYIRLEKQRNEYIKNHKMPRYFDTITQSKKSIDVLSQELDALTNTLNCTKESIEALYDTVKEQLRHANDGATVLEACKHPGNDARWLFGYTEEDDYFLQLSKHLSSRLEEYKKCIWEIERAAESWTQNKKQSPQDIANILRTQNEAFMALSSKVAAIHEKVNAERNNYSQYLRMYH